MSSERPAPAAEPDSPADPQRARLAWRCRRGMKELDLLLLAWLQGGYDRAGPEARAQFTALLALPDPLLMRYLTGAERPADAALCTLIDAISTIMSRARAGAAPEPLSQNEVQPPVVVSAARRPRQIP